MPAFHVKDVTGEHKGESLCYRCQYGNKPVVSIFAREAGCDQLLALVKEVDAKLGDNKEIKGMVVVITEDADKTEATLKEFAAKNKIKNIPLTIFEGKAGPDGYNISKDAAVTVVMWNKSKVKTSKGFAEGKLTADDTKKIGEEIKEVVN